MTEEKKVNTGIDYKNRKYRPSVFIDKSYNEYVNVLINEDMKM